MSKNKYRNYNKPETLNASKTYVEEEVVVEIEKEPETQTESVVETVIGVVANCNRLNIRKNPAPTASIIKVVEAGTKLAIYKDESTVNFYKVCLESGIEGYCMKTYVDVQN